MNLQTKRTNYIALLFIILGFFSLKSGEQAFAVLEIYTSEGCSSCPPADELLEQLKNYETLKDKNFVAVAYHVTYWDYLGWPDRFGQKQFDDMQSDFCSYAGLDYRYTPMIIVNGTTTSNDGNQILSLLTQSLAESEPQTGIELSVPGPCGREFEVSYTLTGIQPGYELSFVLHESKLSSSVTAGENKGKTLTHENVAMVCKTVTVDSETGTVMLEIPEESKIENCMVSAFVREIDGFGIIAATKGIELQPTFNIVSENDKYAALSEGETFVSSLEIQNFLDQDAGYVIEIEKSPDTPVDWTIGLSGSNVIEDGNKYRLNINAKSMATADLKLTAGSTLGVGEVKFKISENISKPLSFNREFQAVSKEMPGFEIISAADEDKYSIFEEISEAAEKQAAMINNEFFLDVYRDLEGTDFLVWNTGATGAITNDEGLVINEMIRSGVKTLIVGSVGLAYLDIASENHDLLATLGLDWDQNSNLKTINSYNINGIDGDPVSDGFSAVGLKINGGESYLQSLNIINDYVCKPILKLNDADKHNIGYRYEYELLKAVVLNFTPGSIPMSSKRQDLIDRCFNWLNGTTDIIEFCEYKDDLKVYPTVTESTVKIKIDVIDINSNENQIRIVNTVGQTVMQIQIENEMSSENEIEVDISGLSAGLYYLLYQSGERKFISGVVKQ